MGWGGEGVLGEECIGDGFGVIVGQGVLGEEYRPCNRSGSVIVNGFTSSCKM